MAAVQAAGAGVASPRERASEAERALALVAGLVLGLGLIVGWVLPTRLGGQTLPVVVTGSSMVPTYAPGDLVLARSGARAEAGQVAVVREPGGGLVVHRVVAVTAAGPITQGDALGAPDAWPAEDLEVVAVASGLVVPRFGQALLALASRPWALAGLCAVVGGLVAVLPRRAHGRRVRWGDAIDELVAAAPSPAVVAGAAVLVGCSAAAVLVARAG